MRDHRASAAMLMSEGPAAVAFRGTVSFGEDGRRTGAQLVIVQWQDGVPVSVYPPDQALGTPRWPKE
jgi:branched-chain amino acid transport system substrate-binding protein